MYKTLPNMPARHVFSFKERLSGVFILLAHKKIAVGMGAVGLFFMGQFALFTYLRPFLENETKIDINTLSLVLLSMGVAGLIGTFVIEKFIKNNLFAVLITLPLLMTAVALLLINFGYSLVLTFTLLSLSGLFGTSAPVAFWTWMSRALPDDAESGGGLMVAIIQASITLRAVFVGALLDKFSFVSAFILAALLLALSAVAAIFVKKYFQS